MLKYLGVQSLRFAEPLYLWLLIAPAALLLLWCWRVIRRRSDAKKYQAARLVPVRDGSASMRVMDMGTDRWQRAMTWVRTLTQTLAWDGDRVALATFADIAVPQIRLTRDPNTILFFLDHLDKQPTFKLEDDTTWDTNVEDAIYWGMKVVDTDREMYGPSKNAKTFVIISDGQVWSGDVQRALTLATQRGIMVDVIGVGTSTGGMIPLPHGDNGKVLAGFLPIHSSLDRISLMTMAREGNGEYFELGTAADQQIASRIIQSAARRSGNERVDESFDELYWYVLAAAAVCLALGLLFLKPRVQLGLGVATTLALLALIASLRS